MVFTSPRSREGRATCRPAEAHGDGAAVVALGQHEPPRRGCRRLVPGLGSAGDTEQRCANQCGEASHHGSPYPERGLDKPGRGPSHGPLPVAVSAVDALQDVPLRVQLRLGRGRVQPDRFRVRHHRARTACRRVPSPSVSTSSVSSNAPLAKLSHAASSWRSSCFDADAAVLLHDQDVEGEPRPWTRRGPRRRPAHEARDRQVAEPPWSSVNAVGRWPVLRLPVAGAAFAATRCR